MTSYSSFTSIARARNHQLHFKYHKERWFVEALGYFIIRYHPIEERVLHTFRYVELAPKNAAAFSYEFGSILRDIGSVFSSILDKFVKNTTKTPSTRYDISHYLKFLIKEVEAIELIGGQLYSPFARNMIFPFYSIKKAEVLWKDRLEWWMPYTNLKHSEIDNLRDGCLTNVVYGMASLAILYNLMYPYRFISKLFSSLGYFKPMDTATAHSFPPYNRAHKG